MPNKHLVVWDKPCLVFRNPSRTGDLPHGRGKRSIETFDIDCDAVLVFKSGGRDLCLHVAGANIFQDVYSATNIFRVFTFSKLFRRKNVIPGYLPLPNKKTSRMPFDILPNLCRDDRYAFPFPQKHLISPLF